MSEIQIRAAQPEDREEVLAFCEQTWAWGDYIAEAWDSWLADAQGALLVASVAERVVGLIHLRMLNESDAWLEGLRVDPAYRGQGIGSVLHQAALAEALRRGATSAGLITEAGNTASIRVARRGFMREVGSVITYCAEPLQERPARLSRLTTPEKARADDLEEIIDYLNASNIFPLTGGRYYEGFTAHRITDRLLKAKITAGQVYLLRRWQRLDGLALTELRNGRHGPHLFIGYIDGATEAISEIAYALRQEAAKLNQELVRANVPDLMMVRDALVGAEYEVASPLYLTFERSLT
jgi:GNAT superfamily N-acetyltransferase